MDNLGNEENSEDKPQEREPDSTSDGYLSSEVDQASMGQYDRDSSGNGTRFKGCTGIFSLDFLPSPKVPKGKGKKSTSDVDISEGTSGGDQLTSHSQSSNGMGTDKSEQSPVLLNTEASNDDAGEINDGGDEITCTVNVMGSEGDEYLPPSGTVAVRPIAHEPHFNIVKGRFCGKGGKVEFLWIKRKYHLEFVSLQMWLHFILYYWNWIHCTVDDDREKSTDGSDSDTSVKPADVNAFREVKTSRYNRPPRDKKKLDMREKIPTRRSCCIKEILKSKSEMEQVSFIWIFVYILITALYRVFTLRQYLGQIYSTIAKLYKY